MSKLALFAGIVSSDGHLDKDFHAIRIITTSNSFLTFLKNLTKEVTSQNFKVQKSKSGFGRDRHVIYINNKNLYELLQTKFNIPTGKKSSIIKPAENLHLQEDEKISYIKGLFAGDGSVSHDQNLQIELWSKSKHLVTWLKRELQNFGVNSSVYFDNKKKQFLLMIRQKESVKSFIENFSFVHPEKQEKLISLLGHPRFRTL